MNNKTFSSVEAEQAVLGGLFINPALIDDVLDIIATESFAGFGHQQIFRAMVDLSETNKPIDEVTTAEQLQANGQAPDMAYLIDLHQNANASNIKTYAAIINDCFVKRKVFEAASESIRAISENPQWNSSECIEYTQSRVIELNHIARSIDTNDFNTALKNYIDHVDYLHQQGDTIDGLATFLSDIDSRVNGYKDGDLVVIAGRPSMGKTTLALSMAANFSIKQKLRGLYFSLEMPETQLVSKLISYIGKIPLNHLKKPSSTNDEFWSKLSASVQQCKDSPLQIVDTSSMHINQLKAYARKAHKREPLSYLMVDHMHLMDGDGKSNAEKFGSISRGLKQLAKELDIPVFALAQLNRGVEDRPNKRPRLSDLRESGRVEEDADMVQLIYRDEYYNEDTPNPGVIELNTAKFRNGETGTDFLAAQLHISRIDDLAPGLYREPPPKPSTANLRNSL